MINSKIHKKQRQQKDKILLSFGMISSLMFILISSIDGVTRPKFISTYHWISHLSLGNRAWLGISNAIIIGILMLLFSIKLKQVKFRDKHSNWQVYFFYILSISQILSAIFIIDPIMNYPLVTNNTFTIRGMIHVLLTSMIIISLISNCFIWSKKKSNIWFCFSIFSGVVILFCSVIFSVLAVLDLINLLPGTPSGLFERVAFYTGFIWIFCFSYWLTFRNETNN